MRNTTWETERPENKKNKYQSEEAKEEKQGDLKSTHLKKTTSCKDDGGDSDNVHDCDDEDSVTLPEN